MVSSPVGMPAQGRAAAIVHVVITTILAAGLPLAFVLLAPESARAWGGVLLLGLLGYAAIRSGWAWLLPFSGAAVLLPILVNVNRWQPAYTWASAALSVVTAVLVITLTVRSWRRWQPVAPPVAAIAAPSPDAVGVAEVLESPVPSPAPSLPADLPPPVLAVSPGVETWSTAGQRHPLSAGPVPSMGTVGTSGTTGTMDTVPPAPATPIRSTVPAAPAADIPMVVSPDGMVSISWASPHETGGAPVIDFAVEVSKDGGVTWAAVPREASPECTAVISQLEFGVPHSFRVAAVNAAGRGTFSGPTAAIIPIGPPGPPHSVTGTAADRAVHLRWHAPADDGGAAITGYRMEVSGDAGASWVTVKGHAAADPSGSVPNLANGTAYVFRVRAVNAAGEGAPSEPSAAAVPAGPPSAPGPVTVTPQVGGLDVLWTPPAKDGGVPIREYLVEVSSAGEAHWETVATTAACSASLTGLTASIAYNVRVAASNGVCSGAWVHAGRPASPIGVPGAVPSVVAHFANGARARMLTAAPASPASSAPSTPAAVPQVFVGSPAAGTQIALATQIPAEQAGGPARPGGARAARWVTVSVLILAGLVIAGVALRSTVLSDMTFRIGQSSASVPGPSGGAGDGAEDAADGSPVVAPAPDAVGPPGPAPANAAAPEESSPVLPAPSVNPATLPVPMGAVVGSISFQRDGAPLVFDAPLVVRQGVSQAELALGPGHYPATSLPGEAGNSAIAGHRTGGGSPFLHLDDLRVGDQVLFTDPAGRVMVFSVHTTAVVYPDEVWVLGPDPVSVGAPTLTLTTCDPPHVNTKRLVVFAVLDPQA